MGNPIEVSLSLQKPMSRRTLLCLIRVEIAVCDNAGRLADGNGDNANDRLHAEQEEVKVEVAPRQDVLVRHRHED